MSDLSSEEQDQVVGDLAVSVETLSDEEFDDLYSKLDVDHQMQVDENLSEFANGAVGDEHWDSDS